MSRLKRWRTRPTRERPVAFHVRSAEMGWAKSKGRPLTEEEIDDLEELARKVKEVLDGNKRI